MKKREKSFKIILVPIQIVIYCFAIIFSLYIIGTIFFERQTMDIFRYRHYIIASESMKPAINKGDIIIIRKYDLDALKPGDIISFYVDVNLDGKQEVVTHYIYSVELGPDDSKIFKTISEKSNTPDSWNLKEEQIIGKYVYQISFTSKLILFIQSPIGRMAILNNLLIITMIAYLLKKQPYNKQIKRLGKAYD